MEDSTQADPSSPTRVGGLPATTTDSLATQILAARPSASGTGHSHTTAGEVLDRSDLPRMRAFHTFGVLAPVGAVVLSLAIGGDPTARLAFWAGACVLLICNIGLIYVTANPQRAGSAWVGIFWIMSTLGILPALAYFGPFSAVVIVPMLGIVFIAIGRVAWIARATAGICIGGHAGLAVPMLLGWIPDRGVLSARFAEVSQMWAAEALIIGFLTSGYLLGRWARRTSATALAELQQAMRVIGDKEQALAEVVDEAHRANRANEGRWTHQMMGHFRLGLVLGRGAMGEVYEAVRSDGTPAAVKLLNARSTASTLLVERFHRELDVAARLESPHIVRVFELSAPDAPVPYLAMERLHGIDLATRLRAEPRLPSDELVVLIDQVARGLEVARLANVVHRDLKPHNLFFHDGASWKILDFGVSKVLGDEGTLTGEGIVGTPQYMAPEQAAGKSVTHAADVYALGAIAYRCLTGRTPFRGRDLAELVYQVVHAAPVRPSALGDISPLLEDVLAVAMAKDPRRRFPSALAFALAFIAARRGRPAGIEPPGGAWATSSS
ncbi:MAG TPA: serine/threonine-protein kinase [Kofleriaceae bacterium]